MNRMKLASINIPYYVVKNGNGFWSPSARMRKLGFKSVPCGRDGPDAWARAQQCNIRWREAVKPNVTELAPSERGYVYFLKVNEAVKIGFSKKPTERLSGLMIGNSGKVHLFVAVAGTKADERKLHRLLGAYRIRGEWFEAHQFVLRAVMWSIKTGKLGVGHDGAELEQKLEYSEFCPSLAQSAYLPNA